MCGKCLAWLLSLGKFFPRGIMAKNRRTKWCIFGLNRAKDEQSHTYTPSTPPPPPPENQTRSRCCSPQDWEKKQNVNEFLHQYNICNGIMYCIIFWVQTNEFVVVWNILRQYFQVSKSSVQVFELNSIPFAINNLHISHFKTSRFRTNHQEHTTFCCCCSDIHYTKQNLNN